MASAPVVSARLDALVCTPQDYVDLLCFCNQVSLILTQLYGHGCAMQAGDGWSAQDRQDMRVLRALDRVLSGYVQRIGKALPHNVCACTCDLDTLERGVQLHVRRLPAVRLGADGEAVLAGLRLLARELREGLFVDLATTARLWARFCRFMAAILEVIEAAPTGETEAQAGSAALDEAATIEE